MNQILIDVEENIADRKKTDRRMWFSMWILLSIVTFGAAWFIMIYYLIKRRNEHFARQEKLEQLAFNWFKSHNEGPSRTSDDASNDENQQDFGKPRHALVWTASTLLIFPSYCVYRFLMEDLHKHEEHNSVFLQQVEAHAKNFQFTTEQSNRMMIPKSITLRRYITFTLITLGLAGVYWLYLIFNDYNNHFKKQWAFEDELIKTLKSSENPLQAPSRDG